MSDDLTATYVKVAVEGELAPGTARRVDVAGTAIALVLTRDDGYRAILDVCSHADVALSEGEVEGCALECWLHGSQFDLRTGRPLSLPAILPVPVYDVRVVDGAIEISTEPKDIP